MPTLYRRVADQIAARGIESIRNVQIVIPPQSGSHLGFDTHAMFLSTSAATRDKHKHHARDMRMPGDLGAKWRTHRQRDLVVRYIHDNAKLWRVDVTMKNEVVLTLSKIPAKALAKRRDAILAQLRDIETFVRVSPTITF